LSAGNACDRLIKSGQPAAVSRVDSSPKRLANRSGPAPGLITPTLRQHEGGGYGYRAARRSRQIGILRETTDDISGMASRARAEDFIARGMSFRGAALPATVIFKSAIPIRVSLSKAMFGRVLLSDNCIALRLISVSFSSSSEFS